VRTERLTLEAERVLLRDRREEVAEFHRREGVLARLAAFGLATGALYTVSEWLALDASEDTVQTRERRLQNKD
jgi:crotonobetainyl-CoA:carnitine CoA-transferase CaiB-like acyl-CoA transferase